jgi:hypothetical protein
LALLRERRTAIEAKLADARTALQAAHDGRRQILLDADLTDAEAVARRDQACRDADDRAVREPVLSDIIRTFQKRA